MIIAIPMVNKNNKGSTHEVVEIIKMIIMIGSNIAIAFTTSETDIDCDSAAFIASPVAELFSPMSL
jgi:hypothetical protein